MKHTSWLSGLAAVRSPSSAATLADLLLGELADGKPDAGQLVLAQHVQHVGLVLVAGSLPRAQGPSATGSATTRA